MKHSRAIALSAVAGLTLVIVAGTHAQEPTVGDPIFRHPAPPPEIRVAGIYDPRDAVRLHSGSFVVPARKLLVMTALGSFQGGPASVQIDNFWPNGTPENISVTTLPSAPTVSFPSPGIIVPAGSTVQTGVPLNPSGIVYGYLADAPDSKEKARSTDPHEQAVRIIGLPGDPREFVYIRSNPSNPNDSYTVPAGKRLVVTGIGSSHDCLWASVRDYNALLLYVEPLSGSLFYQVPAPGIPIASGRVVNPVAVSSADPYPGRIIGYLVDV
jgi:hypothetical protein